MFVIYKFSSKPTINVFHQWVDENNVTVFFSLSCLYDELAHFHFWATFSQGQILTLDICLALKEINFAEYFFAKK
jgi:hypothetical protein